MTDDAVAASAAPSSDASTPNATTKKRRRPMPKTVEAKIAEGVYYKEEGNRKFKAGKYRKALVRYHKVFCFIKGLPRMGDDMSQYASAAGATPLSADSETQVDALSATVHNNLAMTYLKLGEAEKAVDAADRCLKLQPKNIKALFRKAQAFAALNDTDAALGQCGALLALDPAHKTGLRLKARLLKAQQVAQKRADAKFRRAFRKQKDNKDSTKL
jgi:FK506-binding protein 4/5